MAWSFGDGFDLYAQLTDMSNGYWDTYVAGGGPLLVAGRFAGSRGINWATNSNLVKSSGVNDAVHHIAVAFQIAAVSGSTLGAYIALVDGATFQCTVVFRSDGAIILASGGSTGTILATYAGAFPVANTWYAFEFEVIISNTTGRFRVRRNGNSVDDFDSGAVLNTRTTANNYANKLQIGVAATGSGTYDDVFWRSDASSVPWLGDMKCVTRMPVSDQSVQFSRVPTSVTQTPQSTFSGSSFGANVVNMSPFTASYSGTISSATFLTTAASTSHVKFAIYDSTRTTVLGTATEVTNPINGTNPITFPTPVTVVKGGVYYLARDQDASTNYMQGTGGGANFGGTVTYASFPTTAPSVSSSGNPLYYTVTIVTTVNADMVSEAQQDALVTYAYDSTMGHADFYGIGGIGTSAPPYVIAAVTTRGYMQKSDAGTRTAAVQVKSGATTVASPTLTLATSGWQWAWRMDTTDPNTSAAWTPSAVDSLQVGPRVIA